MEDIMSTALKSIKVIFIALFILSFTKTLGDSIGKISFILGSPNEVNILKNNSKVWTNAKLYSKVFNGDKIKTKQESRCEIKLNNQSLIRIGENSLFHLKNISNEISEKSELSFGRIWFNLKKLLKKDRFTLKTPTAVCSVRGTIFRVESDSSTRIAVYDGAVDVGPVWIIQKQTPEQKRESGKSLQPYEVPAPHEIPPPFEVTLQQWIQIVQGYQIEIKDDGKYAKTKINEAVDNKLEWVNWNKKRDKLTE